MSDTIEPNEKPAHAPVRRAASIPVEPVDHEAPEERREFFGDAMKEALGPLAGLLERKIQPLLSALEALPMEAERFAEKPIPQGFAGGVLDQPQDDSYDALPAPDPVVHLMPPGAAKPNADGFGGFESLCTRCGDCV